LTRRFDIGPILLALGALLLLVGLFLDWYGPLSAWDAFEVTDVLLAALGVAALIAAAGLLAPEAEYVDRRLTPWIAGAAFVLVVAELLNPPPGASGESLGTGAWLALAGVVIIAAGTVLSLGRVSLAVAVEGRDRRRRVAAVDHQGPPTETGAPVGRSSEPLLRPRPAEPEAPES
jgi:hypothetical protein